MFNIAEEVALLTDEDWQTIELYIQRAQQERIEAPSMEVVPSLCPSLPLLPVMCTMDALLATGDTICLN